MMRIALVAGGLPLGGSTMFTLFLATALRDMSVPVEVFSFTKQNPLEKEFSDAGITVRLQDDSRFIYEDRLQRLYTDLRQFKPTAVFAVLGAEAFELLRYLPPGIARLGIFHDRAIQPHIFGPRYRQAMDHLVVVAAYLREDMHSLDPLFPCTYLAHGIPLPRLPPRTGNPAEPLRLLYYGRFENDSKGVRLFPQIIAALKHRHIPFSWRFHGYGPDEDFLRQALATEIEKGEVIFSGPVSYEELPSLVRQHDVYMLASTNEGGPLTLLEAMGLGLVPVCGDIPCLIQEVITPENGFRVRRDNPDAYAAAIERLDRDRVLLESLSMSARQTISNHYSAQAMAKRYVLLLQKISPEISVRWPPRILPKAMLGVERLKFNPFVRQFRRIAKWVRH